MTIHGPGKAKLTELLERVKAATGPDRELDYAIWLMFDPKAPQAHAENKVPLPWLWLVTSSIDAVLALVERVLPGHQVNMHSYSSAGAEASIGAIVAAIPHRHKSIPLAILAALLSALSQIDNTGGGE